MALVIIGFGNVDRGDDAAGVLAARSLRACLPDARVIEEVGDGTLLSDLWGPTDDVVVLDALAASGPGGPLPGEVLVFDAREEPLPAGFARNSTHAFGVPEGIELARALGRMPKSLSVVAIVGSSFEPGAAPAPAVAAGIERAVGKVTAVPALSG
jgi:hydrogenase maturation protease